MAKHNDSFLAETIIYILRNNCLVDFVKSMAKHNDSFLAETIIYILCNNCLLHFM